MNRVAIRHRSMAYRTRIAVEYRDKWSAKDVEIFRLRLVDGYVVMTVKLCYVKLC